MKFTGDTYRKAIRRSVERSAKLPPGRSWVKQMKFTVALIRRRDREGKS